MKNSCNKYCPLNFKLILYVMKRSLTFKLAFCFYFPLKAVLAEPLPSQNVGKLRGAQWDSETTWPAYSWTADLLFCPPRMGTKVC